eukprot:TRINITY_DN80534_c0_g1_i1.p1 TRINITY_DN80534_c0_g1~~TRINITY_DN80534_c0_g1_i1.p1  ORF type:complete len:304 (-),score=26.66 TRINITY_DN80534_c0_g1_i1:62-973(-)
MYKYFKVFVCFTGFNMRCIFASLTAIAFMSGHALAQTCARIPPPPMGNAALTGEDCPNAGTLPPPELAPRSSGPCGTPCAENTWYQNVTISPLKGVGTLMNSCIPFRCGLNYSNWVGTDTDDDRNSSQGVSVKSYPTGNFTLLNTTIPKAFAVECTSQNESARVIVSNGLPSNFAYVQAPAFLPCEAPFFVKLPLKPSVVNNTVGAFEVPIRGPIAISLQGVAIFNAQDGGGTDAVASEIAVWVGHATPNNMWHFHGSTLPVNFKTVSPTLPKSSNLVGYAFDGFPIYGPTDEKLDVCNHGAK